MLKHQGLVYYLFLSYAYTLEQEEIGVDELIYLFRPFSFNPQAVRVLLSRLKKNGIVSNRRAGKKSYYFLTEEGKKRLAWGGNQIFAKQPLEWNGKWRTVVYNIPEKIRKKRDEFRFYLMFNRYGCLNNGIWISPEGKGGIPLESLKGKIYDLGIESYVQIFTAENLGPGDNGSIVAKAYNLEKMIAEYKNFIKKYQAKMVSYQEAKKKGKKIQIEKYYVERFELAYDFLELIKLDPKLPGELLPADWNGGQAEKLFHQYACELNEPTYAYFGREVKISPTDMLAIFPI